MELNNNSVSLSAGSWMPVVQWLRPGWLDNSRPERGTRQVDLSSGFWTHFPGCKQQKWAPRKVALQLSGVWETIVQKLGIRLTLTYWPHTFGVEQTRPSHEKLLQLPVTNVAEQVWKRPIPWGINVATAKKLETSTSLGRPTGGGRASWCLPRGCSMLFLGSLNFLKPMRQVSSWTNTSFFQFGQLYKCTDLWVSHWNKTWQRSRLLFPWLGWPNICYDMCQLASQEKVYTYMYSIVSNYHPNNLRGTLFVCWPTIW